MGHTSRWKVAHRFFEADEDRRAVVVVVVVVLAIMRAVRYRRCGEVGSQDRGKGVCGQFGSR